MKFELIEGWKKAYAMYSIWFFAILGAAPDLFNLAVENHLVDSGAAPALLARIINIIAFVGAASRLVKQKALAAEAAASQSNTPAS